MAKKDLIGMILAGGQGSRLGSLTNLMAKPAVPFGSRYRIIDFPLSNCTNSGIDTVGVLTQYEPLALNTYVGNGHPWDLDRTNGGASILPPYQHNEGSDWYKNTANAIYQNIGFIDSFEPKFVVILSGDHIYKMDYEKMLRVHIEQKADATIAVLEVPWDEASRFGIMNADENDNIVEFEEKPKNPKSNLASMGIYMFSWATLRQALIEDENDPNSSHDFGHNIIPKYLNEGRKLYAYRFQGYWKDVGTISSLWQANMDLLDTPKDIDLRDSEWRIYSRNPVKPAAYISDKANVVRSAFTDGCRICGNVEHSILSHSVVIEEGAVVRNSVLMPGAVVRKGAVVDKALIGMDAVVGANCIIGGPAVESHPYANKYCTHDIAVVSSGITVKADAQVPGNCMVQEIEGISAEDNVVEASVAVR